MKITIDAKGKRPGRIASEAARLLMGKMSTAYKPYKIPDIKVEITNASQMDIKSKKREGTVIERYSGYHSGLKQETWAHLGRRRGYKEILRHAIRGMVRRNKLRAPILKNLTISE